MTTQIARVLAVVAFGVPFGLGVLIDASGADEFGLDSALLVHGLLLSFLTALSCGCLAYMLTPEIPVRQILAGCLAATATFCVTTLFSAAVGLLVVPMGLVAIAYAVATFVPKLQPHEVG